MAAMAPNTAMSGFSPAGRLKASRRPVTTALRSKTVFSRFITRRQMYSHKTQEATLTAMSSRAWGPKIMTEATAAGARAMITSSMSFWVVAPLLMWGEAETINFFSIYFFPPFLSRAFPMRIACTRGRPAGQL